MMVKMVIWSWVAMMMVNDDGGDDGGDDGDE